MNLFAIPVSKFLVLSYERAPHFASAISLTPWLQPGDPETQFPFQPFQRFSAASETEKRLRVVEIVPGPPG